MKPGTSIASLDSVELYTYARRMILGSETVRIRLGPRQHGDSGERAREMGRLLGLV